MKYALSIVDTLENLESSNTIIPDGMIVKVENSNTFKVGNGLLPYAQLQNFSESITSNSFGPPDYSKLKYIDTELTSTAIDTSPNRTGFSWTVDETGYVRWIVTPTSRVDNSTLNRITVYIGNQIIFQTQATIINRQYVEIIQVSKNDTIRVHYDQTQGALGTQTGNGIWFIPYK